MTNLIDKFKLHAEKEDHESMISTIDKGVVFKGTNLWILIFAVFVASLGLNVNSTAVIIGAMLISPLMGPIMGIGLGLAINDIVLLKKAMINFLIATVVALVTSTLFFLVSPLDEAHSEILARTSPSIYDVLIALFGGFAGMTATSSKLKGNVIPGVAIATALMPPLCTAGYGLATFRFEFFFGAFYLFIINTVFIALATFIIARLLRIPLKHLVDQRSERRAQTIVWVIVLVTLIPSIYLGYDLVQQDRFIKNAKFFIENEAQFPENYLLNKDIDPKLKKINLVFGGKAIDSAAIVKIENRLKLYKLKGATLSVKQGFSYLFDKNKKDGTGNSNKLAIAAKEQALNNAFMQQQVDSIQLNLKNSREVFAELKAQYPGIKSAIITPAVEFGDSSLNKEVIIVSIEMKELLSPTARAKLMNWLKLRLKSNNIQLNVTL